MINKNKTAFVCLFIGHSDISYSDDIEARVRDAAEGLIKQGVKTFYNGGMGQFDGLCARVIKELKCKYDVKSYLVTPYPHVDEYKARNYDEVIYPALEKCHYKGAIIRRNRYMVEHSGYAITYVTHGWGGAAATFEYAQKKGLTMIDVSGACYYDIQKRL